MKLSGLFSSDAAAVGRKKSFPVMLLAGALLLKLFLLGAFSSDYQNRLFIPFVERFLSTFSNPWDYFAGGPNPDIFPYHPLMLYILSFFYAPYYFVLSKFGLTGGIFAANFFFKLPYLLADVSIFALLWQMVPRAREAAVAYFLAPVVIYAAYMHSQVDLVPTALLLGSFYFLTGGRCSLAGLLLGLAASTKLHVVTVAPLMFIFLLRNFGARGALKFTAWAAAAYLFFLLPYLSSPGFFALVLHNPKQMMLFSSVFRLGSETLVLPFMFVLLLYARFAAYPKVNADLLYTFSGILFAVFIASVTPAPGWYVWIMPFMMIFMAKVGDGRKVLALFCGLNAAYLLYFVFFYVPDHADLVFFHTPLAFKLANEKLYLLSFTLLETLLVMAVYALYKFGVRSNKVYRKDSVMVVGIGGDSGAGKTVLLEDLSLVLGEKATRLEGDAEHKWERYDGNWESLTHLDPKANLLHTQFDFLFRLKSGSSVYRREYDHASGKFTEERKVKPSDFLLLSGLHTFYLPGMRRLTDLKIYMDTDEKLRHDWKLARDSSKRGHAAAAVAEQLEKRRHDAEKYIHPQKNFADMVVRYYTGADGGLALKVVLDSGIRLDGLTEYLAGSGIKARWDYSEDLKSQELELYDEEGLSAGSLSALAARLIYNPEELTAKAPVWRDGRRGFVQLLILLALSHKMKGEDPG